MSLRVRFTLTVALVAALAAALATTLSYRSTADRLDRAVEESLRASARRMERDVQRHGINLDRTDSWDADRQSGPAEGSGVGPGAPVEAPDREPDSDAVREAEGIPTDSTTRRRSRYEPGAFFRRGGSASELVATQWIDTEGAVVQQPNLVLPVSAADKQIAAAASKRSMMRTVTLTSGTYRQLTVGVPGEGAIIVARNIDENEKVMADLLRRFVLLVCATSVAGALASWLLARNATRRLVHMEQQVTAMAATGELTPPEPLDTSGSDEASKVARAFERLVVALQTSRQQQQRLVEDASHELRTPLTSLRTNLSILPKIDRLGPTDRANLVADVQSEVEELVRLVNELVDHATAGGSQSEPGETIALLEFTERCASVIRRRTTREIVVAGDDSLVFAGSTGLARAISNLIGNAVKFDQSGEPIAVTVASGTVTVRDHGPGIDPHDLDRLFDRFYRAEAARAYPGSGLGLSIVSEVAKRWGGTATAANAPDRGALFSLQLPPPPGVGDPV
jgi:two-component system, OmpR family, sensor histidine kinase MprB